MRPSFLEHQARIGISVHLGGWPATRRLLALCHVTEASEVLDVGCGIGVGPVAIARLHGCRVVGADRSPRMVDWARQRARAEGVEERITCVVADVLALPFDDDRFDVVIAESVLSFVVDKERAIAEMVRVTKPGGHVGLNEGFLLTEAPTPRVAELAHQIGSAMVTLPVWQALWAGSGLTDRLVQAYGVDASRELRDRFRWVGLPRLAAASARAALLWVADPGTRPVLRAMRDALRPGADEAPGTPPPWASFGYGLFVGRKPAPGAGSAAGRVARGPAGAT
jgi:SAM-dependent methyltransferase